MMEAIRSSETSVLTRAIWRHIPEDVISHCQPRENVKSSKFILSKTLLRNYAEFQSEIWFQVCNPPYWLLALYDTDYGVNIKQEAHG
jgi:hypothetical protein